MCSIEIEEHEWCIHLFIGICVTSASDFFEALYRRFRKQRDNRRLAFEMETHEASSLSNLQKMEKSDQQRNDTTNIGCSSQIDDTLVVSELNYESEILNMKMKMDRLSRQITQLQVHDP